MKNRIKPFTDAIHPKMDEYAKESFFEVESSKEIFDGQRSLVLKIKPIKERPNKDIELVIPLEKLKTTVEEIENWNPLPPGEEVDGIEDAYEDGEGENDQ